MSLSDVELPLWLSCKESTCNVGDLGLIPGLRRSSGEGKGYPLQYSFLENPRDRGAWWAAIYGVTQSQTWLKWLSSSSGSYCSKLVLHDLKISSLEQAKSREYKPSLVPSQEIWPHLRIINKQLQIIRKWNNTLTLASFSTLQYLNFSDHSQNQWNHR